MTEAFDNMRVEDLRALLDDDATLKRYAPLIAMRDELIRRLRELGIEDKYAFFEWRTRLGDGFSEAAALSRETLDLLSSFLHLHDFKPRRLSEIDGLSATLCQALTQNGIKTSGDYLALCAAQGGDALAAALRVDEREAERLFCLCDLMRLPGVKHIRASLYLACGYATLEDFSAQTPEGMRSKIGRYVAENHAPLAVPFHKELSTQIAVAKILPHLSFRRAPYGKQMPTPIER